MIDNLPKYQPGGDKPLCDVCKKKGKDVQPAVMYCTVCTKRHCKKHQEVSRLQLACSISMQPEISACFTLYTFCNNSSE